MDRNLADRDQFLKEFRELIQRLPTELKKPVSLVAFDKVLVTSAALKAIEERLT